MKEFKKSFLIVAPGCALYAMHYFCNTIADLYRNEWSSKGFFGYMNAQIILVLIAVTAISYLIVSYLFKDDDAVLENLKHLSDARWKSQHPQPEKEYLTKTLDKPGFLLGKYGKNLYRIPFDSHNVFNTIVVGEPGSGKSSCAAIPSILQNNSVANLFVLDIKKELVMHTNKMDDPNVWIIDPSSWSFVGWDPYYKLTEQSSMDDVLEVLEHIAKAIIVSSDPKDLIFVDSARNIFVGIMAYKYVKGYGFIDSIMAILNVNLQDLLAEVLTSDVNIKIKSYVNCYTDDNDTTQSFKVTLRQYLQIFSKDVVKYKLQDCAKKANPSLLLHGKNSIYLSINDSLIPQYKPIFRLITAQVLDALGDVSEYERQQPGTRPIILYLDEFPSLGNVESFEHSLSLYRSRQVYAFICIQNIQQLIKNYQQYGFADIWANCTLKVIFSTSDKTTGEIITALCGKFDSPKESISSKEYLIGKDRSHTHSQERQNIIEPSDLLKLKKTNQVLIVGDDGFKMLEKNPYYKTPYLANRAQEYMEYNKKFMEEESHHE